MSTINRHIPGTIKVEGREHLYISDDGGGFFAKSSRTIKRQSLFDKVTSLFEIAQSGGVISENCKLRLPTNELFHGLSYKGDIEGWRKQIEQGAEQLGLLTGKISENNIELSDGRIYALSDCKIEFY